MNEIIIVDKPDVIFKDVNSRKDGVSGFIRCKNEDEFIDQVIHSWLENSDDLGAGFLDELVVVYNDCIDKTEEVLKQLLKIYPNKLKIYHYIPKVFAQGTKEYKELGADDYQSLVNYYNFALSKTTYKWAVKIDGDIILDPIKTADIKKYMLKMKPNEYLKLSGINIIMQRSEIYCLSGSVFCGLFSDLCLFKVHKDTFYKKDKYCEVMNFPSEYTKFKDKKLFINNTLTAYYHMKFQKNDFGFGVYDFKNNHNSNYYPKTWIFILTSHLVPLSKILKQYKLNMTNPKDFISFQNNYDDYKTSFIDALKQSNKKDCSISVWIDEAGLFVINKIYKWGGVQAICKILKNLKSKID
ncbi:hypothetical protein [Campylobacter mucosalis]|uniref:Glycosyltransferase, family 2 n=1 Tax=Campylobacter mucosalis CCUG 21559 TaxID=1032067 RepID=A0A6G5QI58_9BACT|nr:hypothetical protein [Campylobacter mucosalis]QCD45341.1 hypothetical protein CMUC_1591 [Campylobacter mucosalis CCUG 21559]